MRTEQARWQQEQNAGWLHFHLHAESRKREQEANQGFQSLPVIVNISCQTDTTRESPGKEPELKTCLDQIGLWLCL